MRYLLILFVIGFVVTTNAQVSRTYDNGAALFAQGDYAGAKIMMSRVINQSQYYFEAYTIRGRAFELLGLPDSALIDFNKAIEIKPDFLPAVYFRGVLYYNQKNYLKAIVDFDLILNSKADYINALIYRGRTQEGLGNKEAAIADYTTAINLKLKNYEVYFRRGLLYEKERMYKSAVWDFDKAVVTKPDFVEGYLHRGKMNLLLERYEEAMKDFDKVIGLTDTIPDVYMQRGNLHFINKNYKMAAEDYSKLIQDFRVKDGDLYHKRADAYYLDSNYSAAFKEYARVLEVKPRFDPAIVGQAKVLIMQNKPASAMPYLKKALAFNPNNGEAYFLKGKILYDQKKFIEALADLNLAIKYLPTPAAFFYRGSCKFETNDIVGACLDLQESVKQGYNEVGIQDMVKRVCR